MSKVGNGTQKFSHGPHTQKSQSKSGEIEACKKEIAELKDRIEKHRGDPDNQEQPRTFVFSQLRSSHLVLFENCAVAELAQKKNVSKVQVGLKQRRILKGWLAASAARN